MEEKKTAIELTRGEFVFLCGFCGIIGAAVCNAVTGGRASRSYVKGLVRGMTIMSRVAR